MATVAEKKNGGPYTKDERTKRQNEVSRLYFEYGYSATKISEMMRVNRNTINGDIKYLYSNIKEELRQDSEGFILKQIGRLESQRSRIVKKITEKNSDNDDNESMRHEKLLLEVDAKINNLLIRIRESNHTESGNRIQENKVKDFVLYLLIKYSTDHRLSKGRITSEIVNLWQCSVDQAERIFLQIENMGEKCCRKYYQTNFFYDLQEFALLRRYLESDDPFLTKIHVLVIARTHFENNVEDLEEKYLKTYGDKDKWSEEIFSKHNEKYKEFRTKYTDITSKTIAEALESISDQRPTDTYTRYIDVFFAGEKSQFEKMSDR